MKAVYSLILAGVLVGLSPVGASVVLGDDGANSILRLTVKDGIDMAIKNNPIVLSADLSVRADEESLKVAVAGSLPKIDFGLSSLPTVVGTAPKTETTTIQGKAVEKRTEFGPAISLGGGLSLSQLLPTAGNLTLSLDALLTRSEISKVAVDGQDATPDPNDPTLTIKPGFSLRVDQPLFVDGFALAKVAEDQARASLAISEIGRDKTIKDLSYNVAVAYYNLARARKLTKVSEDAVRQSQDSLDVTRQLVNLGVLPDIDAKKSEVQLGTSQNALISAKANEVRAKDKFYDLLRIDPQIEVQLVQEIEATPIQVSIGEALEEAFKNRPEISQAEEKIKIAETSLLISTRESKPALSLSGGYSFSGSGSDFSKSLGQIKGDSWNLSVGISVPLYDGGSSSSGVGRAEYNLEQSRLALETAKDNILLEIKGIYQTLLETQEKIRVSTQNAALAKETLGIDKEKYSQGRLSNLQLSSSELAYTNAQTDLINAMIDYNVARLSLFQAMGTGLGF